MNQTAEILTLQESTCKRIREMITRGDIASGQRIKESQLARMLGSSRVPVRESLIRLKAEGLVVNKPHYGFRVICTPLLFSEDVQQCHQKFKKV